SGSARAVDSSRPLPLAGPGLPPPPSPPRGRRVRTGSGTAAHRPRPSRSGMGPDDRIGRAATRRGAEGRARLRAPAPLPPEPRALGAPPVRPTDRLAAYGIRAVPGPAGQVVRPHDDAAGEALRHPGA